MSRIIGTNRLLWSDLIGGATFIAMSLLAVHYFQARTTFLDIAFHMFEHATRGEVAIQNYRFVSAITQWLPMKLMAWGASITTVQLVYSLVFPLFYVLVWLTLKLALRTRAWALAWALLWLTFATHTHYWIQSELPQGLAIFTLCLGLIGYNAKRPTVQVLAKAALPILLFVAAFAHPLLIVPATFAFGFMWLNREQRTANSEQRTANSEIVAAAIIYYTCYGIRVLFFSTAYDGQAGSPASGLEQLLAGDVPFSLEHLFSNLLSTYYSFVLVFGLGIWLLWQNVSRLAAVWTFAAVIGHLALVAFSYPSESVVDFYIENLYLPAGWMAAVGLAFGWEQSSNFNIKPGLALPIMAIVVLRVVHIFWLGHTLYQPRLDFLVNQLENYEGEKVVLKETPKLTQKLIMTWGTPYEAWLLSARDHQPTAAYLVIPEPSAYEWAYMDPERLVLTFTQPKFAELPPNRFMNVDSTVGYRVISREE